MVHELARWIRVQVGQGSVQGGDGTRQSAWQRECEDGCVDVRESRVGTRLHEFVFEVWGV